MKPGVWWRRELGTLMKAGILTGDIGEKLEAYYALEAQKSRSSCRTASLVLVGLIAVEILILGIMLLLGGGWSNFSPAVRIILGCLPLAALSGYGFRLCVQEHSQRLRECWNCILFPVVILALWAVWTVYPGCFDWRDLLLAASLLVLPAIFFFRSITALICPVVVVILLLFFPPLLFSVWYAWGAVAAAVLQQFCFSSGVFWRRQFAEAYLLALLWGAGGRIALLDEVVAFPLPAFAVIAFCIAAGGYEPAGRPYGVWAFAGDFGLMLLTAFGSYFFFWEFDRSFACASLSGVLILVWLTGTVAAAAVNVVGKRKWESFWRTLSAVVLALSVLFHLPDAAAVSLCVLCYIVNSLRHLVSGSLQGKRLPIIVGGTELAVFAALRFFLPDGLTPVQNGMVFICAAAALLSGIFGVCRFWRKEICR